MKLTNYLNELEAKVQQINQEVAQQNHEIMSLRFRWVKAKLGSNRIIDKMVLNNQYVDDNKNQPFPY